MYLTMKQRSVVLMVLLALVAALFVVPVGAQDATLTIYVDETRSGPLAELGEQFEADTGIALEVVEFPFGEIRDQFTTAAPAGEGPDMIIGAHDWLGELVVNGLLVEVDLGDKADLFVPAAVNAFNYEGGVYGMPYALENVAFYYNTALVPEAPATWDEVRTISEELQASGDAEYGWVIQENDPYHFFPVQTAFGGYVFAFDAETGYDPSDVGIDSEGTIDAFSFLESYAADGLMPTGLDADGMRVLFEEGQAAMVISGPWDLERFQTALGDDLGIAAVPGTEAAETGRPFLGVQGFMISAFSEQQELANLFLTEYVATDDTMQQLFEAGTRPSAYLPVAENVEDPALAAFGLAGADGLAMPAIPEMGAVWANWGGAMEQIVQGRAEATEALTGAAESIRETIAGDS
jgi:maltose-binding protein MalE